MMNTENGFVILEWPYGLHLTTTAPTRATSRETIANATFACSIVDIRTKIIPPIFEREYPTPEAARDAFVRLGHTLVAPGQTPEVDRTMTLSTAHVSAKTATALARNGEENEIPLAVYPKAQFGWFVYLNGNSDDDIADLPDDLRDCVRFAKANDCSILCLDADGPILNVLPTYEWEDDGPDLA